MRLLAAWTLLQCLPFGEPSGKPTERRDSFPLLPLLLLGAAWSFLPAAELAVELANCFVLRAALSLSTLGHELCHLAAAAALLPSSSRVHLRRNLLGNVGVVDWLWSLVPGCAPAPLLGARVELPAAAAARWRLSIVRGAGWAGSLVMALWVAAAASQPLGRGPFLDECAWLAALAFAATASGALASDLLDLLPQQVPASAPALAVFNCGNFGVLLANVASSGVDFLAVLHAMASVSMQRGGQSGGIVTLRGAPNAVAGVRTRSAGSKRESLADVLLLSFRRALRWAAFRRPLQVAGAGGHALFVGHTRFATSSVPTASESHPHQARTGCRLPRAACEFCGCVGSWLQPF